jgi:hypothetical protein
MFGLENKTSRFRFFQDSRASVVTMSEGWFISVISIQSQTRGLYIIGVGGWAYCRRQSTRDTIVPLDGDRCSRHCRNCCLH